MNCSFTFRCDDGWRGWCTCVPTLVDAVPLGAVGSCGNSPQSWFGLKYHSSFAAQQPTATVKFYGCCILRDFKIFRLGCALGSSRLADLRKRMQPVVTDETKPWWFINPFVSAVFDSRHVMLDSKVIKIFETCSGWNRSEIENSASVEIQWHGKQLIAPDIRCQNLKSRG